MTIHLSEKYPKIIRDFYLCEHSTQTGDAFNIVDLPFGYDREQLLAEAATLPWKPVKRQGRVIGTERVFMYGSADGNDTLGMTLTGNTGIGRYSRQMDMTHVPCLDRLITDLESVGELVFLTVQKMKPGAYLVPHMDSPAVPHKMYIPLNWPEGCYFKYHKQGFIPFGDLEPRIVNVGEHMHSVINDSDQDRIIISVYVDWDTGQWSDVFSRTMKR